MRPRSQHRSGLHPGSHLTMYAYSTLYSPSTGEAFCTRDGTVNVSPIVLVSASICEKIHDSSRWAVPIHRLLHSVVSAPPAQFRFLLGYTPPLSRLVTGARRGRRGVVTESGSYAHPPSFGMTSFGELGVCLGVSGVYQRVFLGGIALGIRGVFREVVSTEFGLRTYSAKLGAGFTHKQAKRYATSQKHLLRAGRWNWKLRNK